MSGNVSAYRRFYELAGVTGHSLHQRTTLRKRTCLIIEPFLDAPPLRKRAAPPDAASSDVKRERGRTSRPRRGRAPAEVVSEKEFSGLWTQLKAEGWKVLAKPKHIAPGDPRTWIWCAPEVLTSPACRPDVFKLRDAAGTIGEDVFLDKDDVWVWARNKGLVAAHADSSDDDSDSSDDHEFSPPPRSRARTEAPAPVYRESKGDGPKILLNYKSKECGECKWCLDNPKVGGKGTLRKACVRRQVERAEQLEALLADGNFAKDRIAAALRSSRYLAEADEEIPCDNDCGRQFSTLGGMRKHALHHCPLQLETEPGACPPPKRRRYPKAPCTICFATVAEGDKVFGSDACEHVFHRHCIEGWARECAERPHNVATRRGVRVVCPNCKKGRRVVTGPVEGDDDGGASDGGGDGNELNDESEPRPRRPSSMPGGALMADTIAPPAVVGGASGGGQFAIGMHVRDAEDAKLRGVVTSHCSSYNEVTTTVGSVLLTRGRNLRPASLTDEVSARCVRPISRLDYLQARIDGGLSIRRHRGREFHNRYASADGTKRRQFEVSETNVRCTLCPDVTWSPRSTCASLLDELRRHCGHFYESRSRYTSSASSPRPQSRFRHPPRPSTRPLTMPRRCSASHGSRRTGSRKPPRPAASPSRSERSLPRPSSSNLLSCGAGRF